MECVADVRATLGEGPVWVEREQALYWVDIPERRLFRWSDGQGLRVHDLSARLCALAPRVGGGFIGAGYDGFLRLGPELDLASLANPEPELPGNRFNDGKVDRDGRFWAGTMDRAEREASGSLYRLDPDLRWTRVDTGYRVTNGPAFSRNGRTMYHNDSALQRVYAFDLDQEGNASDRRVFLQFDEGEGYPDGMTVDREDCLWIAFWDGWCVRRFSPSGARLAEIRLPAQRPTSCAFGGPGLDRLFITTASRDLSAEALAGQPRAGGLFMTVPGVKGIADRPFAG
jgi:sugar lactone lactonase YvrE